MDFKVWYFIGLGFTNGGQDANGAGGDCPSFLSEDLDNRSVDKGVQADLGLVAAQTKQSTETEPSVACIWVQPKASSCSIVRAAAALNV